MLVGWKTPRIFDPKLDISQVSPTTQIAPNLRQNCATFCLAQFQRNHMRIPLKETSVNLEFFFIFHGAFDFFENVQKAEEIRTPGTSAKTNAKKNFFICFFYTFLKKLLLTGSPKFAKFIATVLTTNLVFYFLPLFYLSFIYAVWNQNSNKSSIE